MKRANRLSKQEYAHMYDRHADSLYRFALCVTGDRQRAGSAMAELFLEGYFSNEDENFETHMLKVLWRILESCPPGSESLYREGMERLFPLREHGEMIATLSLLSQKERARVMLRTLFQRDDDAAAGILACRPDGEEDSFCIFGSRLAFAAS